jgi:hypothetical protein
MDVLLFDIGCVVYFSVQSRINTSVAIATKVHPKERNQGTEGKRRKNKNWQMLPKNTGGLINEDTYNSFEAYQANTLRLIAHLVIAVVAHV